MNIVFQLPTPLPITTNYQLPTTNYQLPTFNHLQPPTTHLQPPSRVNTDTFQTWIPQALLHLEEQRTVVETSLKTLGTSPTDLSLATLLQEFMRLFNETCAKSGGE